MYLPPIYGNLTAADAEALAQWHEEKAAAAPSDGVKTRHEVIAFRLFKAAHRRRAYDRTTRKAA